MHLSHADVERLARASSARVRVEVAGKVAQRFAEGGLGGREKDIAVEIFRLLARDAELRVRETLSQHLKSCRDLPHDVALKLAHDVEQVSVPILEHTVVLSDADLITIIESSQELAKLTAIARRESVSVRVAGALLRTRHEAVACEVIGNKGAELAEDDLLRTIEALAGKESVIVALMERGGLPLTCIEKIFMIVSDGLKKKLAEQFHVSRHLIEGRLEYAREMNTLGMSARGDEVDVEGLVRHLHQRHRLTSSIVLRSLCVGDLGFFERAMAELTGIPVENVRVLMRDGGGEGFRALYRQSPLPPAYYDAVKKLLDLALDATHNGRVRPEDFSRRMIDNITANGYDASVEYMPLLLAIIKGNAGEFSSIH